jgi:hypothetical protein
MSERDYTADAEAEGASFAAEWERNEAYIRGWNDAAAEIERLSAALKTAREALANISDNGGDTLTIEDAVRIADAALGPAGPKP